MNPNEPQPVQSSSLSVSVKEIVPPPGPFSIAYTHCLAEAQMLEHAIKSAVTKDVQGFAKAGDAISLLDILEKLSTGQARDMALGTSAHKELIACIRFFDFVKAQWRATGKPEPELSRDLTDAVKRRNRIAHALLSDAILRAVAMEDALAFLKESRERFFDLRKLVVTADGSSSKMGSMASDASSQPHFKPTS